MFFRSWKIFAVILVIAALFRVWGAYDYPGYLLDEENHSTCAISLGKYGTTDGGNWWHPPLSMLMLSGMIELLGDNPYGRRTGNVLLGTASVFLLYLIGLRFFPGGSTALLAASLLALDPFHIYYSRTTFMEVPVTFFFLLYLYLMVEYSENNRPVLHWAGIALGLTAATKAYFIFAMPLIAGYAFFMARKRGERTLPLSIDFFIALVILPISVYLLSYIKWFGRGYTLFDFFVMKQDAFWSLQNITSPSLEFAWYLEGGGRPWEWFLKPLILGHQIYSDGVTGRYLLEINNPCFRLLTIPSLVLISIYAWKTRAVRELLVPLLFAAYYLLFVFIRRPMFSYSAFVVLPIAYLAVARAVLLFAQYYEREKMICTVFLFCVVASGFYTFPLVSVLPIPEAMYRPVLSMAHLIGAH